MGSGFEGRWTGFDVTGGGNGRADEGETVWHYKTYSTSL